MAQYACRIFLDTGFNAVNVPDTPALLEMSAQNEKIGYFDATAIIMQNRFLQSVRIRATWESIKDADYIRIGTSDYYFITGMQMLGNDCCELSIMYDFLTSSGGVSTLQILDGVTTRVHVTDDSFGKYTEDDPLTLPAHPLEIQSVWFQPSITGHTYVEATVNLPQTAGALKGISYLTDEGETVTIPTVKELKNFTEYELADNPAGSNPHTMLYDLNNTDGTSGANTLNQQEAVLKGIKRCRELGIEQGAIINQVQIPDAYVSTADFTEQTVEVDSELEGEKVTVTDRSILLFRGKTGTVQSNIPYSYTGARNNRTNYGAFTPYGLITCSGESCEYQAEDIQDPQNTTAPVLRYLADPHTDGKPYFRWRVVNNNAGDIAFFRNCVTGLQWKQIPLYYKDPSGTAVNTLKYQNSRKITDTQYNLEKNQIFRSTKEGIINDTVQGIASAAENGNAFGAVVSGIGSAIGSGIKYAVNGTQQLDDMYAMYMAKKRSEMSDYLVSNTITAPQINFPYNSELMRDFYGNGCLMYRYKYSSADINRIDKLLTMYGYRYTKVLEASDFTNKQKFNYVECSNVEVTGHPKWMCEGISAMLKSGVRVWHVLPDPTLYNQNNPNA